jgi:3-methyladenine DNA glycosylase AlkD
MRDVAPFLGIPAPERRRALRAAWAGLRTPSSDELGEGALALAARPEREYHYAAADLIARFGRGADERFLDRYVEPLLRSVPWWDTVDALGTAAVGPLCRRFDHGATVDRWSGSGDRWLIRAAIQHQRGWKQGTDVDRVLGLCDRHWDDPEFFVAKAIGWALRDLAWIDAAAVRAFLAAHPTSNRVATREAARGLRASAAVSPSGAGGSPAPRGGS